MLFGNTTKSYCKNIAYEYAARKLYPEKYKISQKIYYGVNLYLFNPKEQARDFSSLLPHLLKTI